MRADFYFIYFFYWKRFVNFFLENNKIHLSALTWEKIKQMVQGLQTLVLGILFQKRCLKLFLENIQFHKADIIFCLIVHSYSILGQDNIHFPFVRNDRIRDVFTFLSNLECLRRKIKNSLILVIVSSKWATSTKVKVGKNTFCKFNQFSKFSCWSKTTTKQN